MTQAVVQNTLTFDGADINILLTKEKEIRYSNVDETKKITIHQSKIPHCAKLRKIQYIDHKNETRQEVICTECDYFFELNDSKTKCNSKDESLGECLTYGTTIIGTQKDASGNDKNILKTICLTCDFFNAISNGKCVRTNQKESKNCEVISYGVNHQNRNIRCGVCEDGFNLLSIDNTTRCYPKVKHCMKMRDSETCAKCEDAYILQPTGKTCKIRFKEGCEVPEVANTDQCVTCNVNYILDNTTKTCKLRTSVVGCTRYFENDDTNTLVCLECEKDRMLIRNKCKRKGIANCHEFTEFGFCKECQKGYRLIGKQTTIGGYECSDLNLDLDAKNKLDPECLKYELFKATSTSQYIIQFNELECTECSEDKRIS